VETEAETGKSPIRIQTHIDRTTHQMDGTTVQPPGMGPFTQMATRIGDDKVEQAIGMMTR